jgi:hypothetical protein
MGNGLISRRRMILLTLMVMRHGVIVDQTSGRGRRVSKMMHAMGA